MNKYILRVQELIKRHQLLSAISLVIIITLVLTSINMVLYVNSGTTGLDLSRPGFDKSRTEIKEAVTPKFEATGPLSLSDYEKFKQLYADQRKNIQSTGSFDNQVLSDAALGLEMSASDESQ